MSNYGVRVAPSSSSGAKWKYDVFLSFRGEDTRKGFTDHLHDKLKFRGIRTFRDDLGLEKGTTISPELMAAIDHSRFAIVVLSANYASSTWCLMELAKIVTCMRKKGTILPVFYEVEPSDVRHQRGSFAKAFDKHKEEFGKDSTKVQEWRDALTKVANMSGWASSTYRYESELIMEIVGQVWKKVHPTFASSETLEKLVGVDTKLMEIDCLLDTKSNDVLFLGIWGMGGIGKTTLAKLVFSRISHHFEISIFLTEVKHVWETQGRVHLQQKLLCQILKENNTQVWDADDGVSKIKSCLSNKKILLVLDDVNRSEQLEWLAAGKDWFGSGSIVIITTRDQRLLVSHGIEKQYMSKGLNVHEALQFFSWKAFKKDKPEVGYRELTESILDYAKGLPLALKILGSFLYKRDLGCWESAVAMLKKAPIDKKLFEVLRISYDGLEEMYQQVFLDVVCFLKGSDEERVFQILDNIFDFNTRIIVDVLVEKSLLTNFDNRVDMHDLIQEMGREIVRLESEKKPGKRSRLWIRDDIFCILKEYAGTETIRSITLCLPKLEELAWNPNVFSRMSELKFLKLQNLVLRQGPECLPDALRVLEWTSYPSKSLPPNFHPVELIELTLHHSNIHQLWHGRMFLEKLTIIDLSYSENFTMTPDFKGIPNLERLILEGCTSLVDIHPSITSLGRLKILNLKKCQSIHSLPSKIEIATLETIDFSGCSKVGMFPQFMARMENLTELSFTGIGMQNFKVSCHSEGPHRLSLIFASLKHFCSLKRLNLSDCELGEGEVPDDIGCLSMLEDLDLSFNNFVSLPASISSLSKLECLNLTDCKRLQQLPDLPLFNGTCHIAADNCISLKKFPNPPKLFNLWKLSFSFINCCVDRGNEDNRRSSLMYSILRQIVSEPPPFFEMFSAVIPGTDIPAWFGNQRVGPSITQRLPCSSSCRSTWMGFALCVVVGPAEKTAAFCEDPDSELHATQISCHWLPGCFVPASFSINLNQVIKSDHLFLFLLPSKHYLTETSNFIEFFFKVRCTKSGSCLEVKRCGVRTLYKEEVQKLNRRIKHLNEAISHWGTTCLEVGQRLMDWIASPKNRTANRLRWSMSIIFNCICT